MYAFENSQSGPLKCVSFDHYIYVFSRRCMYAHVCVCIWILTI